MYVYIDMSIYDYVLIYFIRFIYVGAKVTERLVLRHAIDGTHGGSV